MKPALPGTVPVRASPAAWLPAGAEPEPEPEPKPSPGRGERLSPAARVSAAPGSACRVLPAAGRAAALPGSRRVGDRGAWEPTLRSPGEQGHGVRAVPDSPGCQRGVPGGGGDGWWRLLPSRARRAPGCPSGRWWLPGDPPSGRLFTRLHGDGKVSKAIPCHSPGRGSGIRSSLEGLGGWKGPGVLPSAPAAPVPGLRTGELWAPGEPWAPLGLASSSSSSSSPWG